MASESTVKGKHMRWIAFLGLILSIACTVKANEKITKEAVSAVVNVLASDAMEGREAGTPGAQKAAAFIAKSFEESGLKPLPGAKDLYHRFKMVQEVPGEASLELNGVAISADAIAFRGGGEQVAIDAVDKIDVVHIGPEANPRSNFGQILNNPKPVIALMDPKHSDFFKRIQGFLGRPNNVANDAQGAIRMFVLTDTTEVTSLSLKASSQVSEIAFANVVGVLPGKKTEEMIMFSAHYDHIGKLEAVDGDDIANGADDDASGTTGVILLARHFAAGPQPERTLVFVAFTAEEKGTLGSRAFSRVIPPEQLIAGINMEMIGKPSKFGKGQLFLTGFERSNLGELLQKRLAGSKYAVHPDPYPQMNLFFRSDNAPFARLGVPAHTFSTVEIDKDPYYHTVNDEVETLDMDHFTAAIHGIAKAVEGLVNGEDTPTRVKMN